MIKRVRHSSADMSRRQRNMRSSKQVHGSLLATHHQIQRNLLNGLSIIKMRSMRRRLVGSVKQENLARGGTVLSIQMEPMPEDVAKIKADGQELRTVQSKVHTSFKDGMAFGYTYAEHYCPIAQAFV